MTNGMGLFRGVNAMAMAAERLGNGFAYFWADPRMGDDWDDIAHVVLDAT